MHRELHRSGRAGWLDREQAGTVAQRLMVVDPLGRHARDELGLQPGGLARPLQAAVVSAVSFAVGAALPLTLIMLAPRQVSAYLRISSPYPGG